MRVMFFLLAVAAVVALALILRRLRRLPPLTGRTRSVAVASDLPGRLAAQVAEAAGSHPGSGIVVLSSPHDAFAARVLLVRAAEHSLDVQCYIWSADTSGRMLLDELRQAADLGVRVRLLLDDNGTVGLDETLAALDRHPQVEVRLFNPSMIRRPRMLGYLLDFARLNRRMHNKSLTADNQATIVGGRNVGDAYFGASAESQFADLDILAVGAIVPDVSAQFDRYWASASAYPVTLILPAATRAAEEPVLLAAPLARAYAEAVQEGIWRDGLRAALRQAQWVPVTMVSDDPGKVLGRVAARDMLLGGLAQVIGQPETRLGLVSAYFVPTDGGTALLAGLARSGVKVTVLTNALASTDVALVHAGYARHRKALLRAGVRLFEMKGAGKAELVLWPRSSGARAVIRVRGSSLHAKTFTIDRRRLFVGSFNFDPRSALLNTELGFVIESPPLAGQLQDLMDGGLAGVAYEVRLQPGGRKLEWVEEREGGAIIHRTEPDTGPMQRALIGGLALLPIDWLL